MNTTTERKLARTHAEQIKLAKEELKIEKQWQKDGGKEPKPELPNLDAVRERSDARTQQRTSTSTTSSTPRAPKMSGLRFFHDDKPQPDNQNKLSTMAYDYTRKVDGDTPRVSTARLREILAGLGVADTAKPFKATLPNGVVLELRSESVNGQTSKPAAKPSTSSKRPTAAEIEADADSTTGERPSERVMRELAEQTAAQDVGPHDDEHTVTVEQDVEAQKRAKAAGAAKRTKSQPTQAQKDARNAKRRAERAAKSTKGPKSLSNLLPRV